MTDPTAVPGAGDLDSLLGAYALDALDAHDRARVDAYLAEHADARSEVDDMRETAASLALLPESSMTAPPELWDRIAEVIAAEGVQDGQREGAGGDELAARRAARSRMKWLMPAAAAAAIALVVLAAQVVSLRSQLDNSKQLGSKGMALAFDRAAKSSGAREVGLKAGSGATLARVVLLPDGTGYLRGDKLGTLRPNQTYQLWAVTGTVKAPVVVSAGVLGPHPTAISFRASGPVHAFAVTVETAGGVVTSHHTPIASAQLS